MPEEFGFWISIIVFVVIFTFIITEKVNRTAIAFYGAVLMLTFGHIFDFYTFEAAAEAIDGATVSLLFGMMVLIAVLEKSGFFQYIAIKTAKKTGGDLWKLTFLLGTLTTVLSMFLDNVTTILLIVPVTLVITRMLKYNPTPVLMAEALLSNIGGVGTMIGDPPNILIASASGYTFAEFLMYALPVVVVVWFVVMMMIRVMFRQEFQTPPKRAKVLMKMDENSVIKNQVVLTRSIWTLGIIIVLFFVHGLLHVPAAFIALFGAALLLLLVSPVYTMHSILKKTELTVLLFFASLFVLVGGLEQAGVLEYIATFIISGAEQHLILTALIILWVTAILSSILDNVPMTIAMVPVLAYLEASGVAGANLFWWALVFGVGFGGNGTPVGSTAGVIVSAKSQSTSHPISFTTWVKTGFPVMLVSLLITSVILVFFSSYFMN